MINTDPKYGNELDRKERTIRPRNHVNRLLKTDLVIIQAAHPRPPQRGKVGMFPECLL